MFYLGFCSFLFFHYKEADWNSTKASIYYWALISNNIFNAVFAIIVFIYTIITRKRKPKTSKIQIKEPSATLKQVEKREPIASSRAPSKRERMDRLRACSLRGNNRRRSASAHSAISHQTNMSLREKLSMYGANTKLGS
uniref:Uncharacterized protein n=1 Tax=Euplotes crassus TaxID=5936 RepID=A0A7S3NZ48_EUPCR|mmetsp:Transcript_8992/g.8550  ORF Transcript_8992/g.8550 Transcript_8992/m.8550 type:complete len:139 (+) Transcript_8992:197-613(+)